MSVDIRIILKLQVMTSYAPLPGENVICSFPYLPGNTFDQYVAYVVHFQFKSKTQSLNGGTGIRIPERIIESGHSDTKSIEAIRTSVHRNDWSSCVRFGYSAISFEYYDFGPDFVIDAVPFVDDFLNVILEENMKEIRVIQFEIICKIYYFPIPFGNSLLSRWVRKKKDTLKNSIYIYELKI